MQLGHFAVAQQRLDGGVIRNKPLQHLRGGGIARGALFGGRGQAQPVKEHLAQLARAVEVKILYAGQLIHRVAALVYLAGKPLAQLLQHPPIHQKALALHAKQHAGEGLLHFHQQRLHAPCLYARKLAQTEGVHIPRRGLAGRLAVFGAQNLRKLVAFERGVQQVGGNHGVAAHLGQRQAVAAQLMPQRLGPVHNERRTLQGGRKR